MPAQERLVNSAGFSSVIIYRVFFWVFKVILTFQLLMELLLLDPIWELETDLKKIWVTGVT